MYIETPDPVYQWKKQKRLDKNNAYTKNTVKIKTFSYYQ